MATLVHDVIDFERHDMGNRPTNQPTPLTLTGAALVAALSGAGSITSPTGGVSVSPSSAFAHATFAGTITKSEPVVSDDIMPRDMRAAQLTAAARAMTGGDASHMLDI